MYNVSGREFESRSGRLFSHTFTFHITFCRILFASLEQVSRQYKQARTPTLGDREQGVAVPPALFQRLNYFRAKMFMMCPQ